MRPYAADTDVPVNRSKGAIEALLMQHGATEFASGWDPTHDRMQFRLFDRTIRFTLPRPDPKARKFTHDRRGWLRANSTVQKVIDQADRQRWRALYLVIRAKLEAVEAGIAVFEQEFLAFVVMGNGMTVGDVLVPMLQDHQPLLLSEHETRVS
jgi:hypothetical protein